MVSALMKLYTKTGDDGTTGLFGGVRVPKASARVEGYGTIDETNAAIGVARACQPGAAVDSVLAAVQEDLFVLGAEVACAPGREAKLRMRLLGLPDIERLERAIDDADEPSPRLQTFVLPGGAPPAPAPPLAPTGCPPPPPPPPP